MEFLPMLPWITIALALAYVAGRRNGRVSGRHSGYWEGKGDGWNNCTTFALERAREDSPETYAKVHALLQ